MKNTNTTFVISPTYDNPYPSAYGALRGGISARLDSVLFRADLLKDQNDPMVEEIRILAKRMEECIKECDNAVEIHNNQRLKCLEELAIAEANINR
jgi:hypothetical protein